MALRDNFGRPDDPLTVFLVLAVGGVAFYFAVASAAAALSRRRPRSAEEPPTDPELTRRAIRLSVIATIVNALLLTPIVVLVANGYSRVYYSVADYGWGYLLFSVALLLGFTETMVYWIHRGLHLPWFYRTLHAYHHRFRDPDPWVSMAFHPLDSFAQSVPYHLFAFLLPVHIGVYAGSVVAVTFWTFLIHDARATFRPRVLNFTSHHTVHHVYNKHNYGQFLTVWDRLARTYRSPAEAARRRSSSAARGPLKGSRGSTKSVPAAGPGDGPL